MAKKSRLLRLKLFDDALAGIKRSTEQRLRKKDLLCKLIRPGQLPPCRIKRALRIRYSVNLHFFRLFSLNRLLLFRSGALRGRVSWLCCVGRLLFMRQEEQRKHDPR